MRAIGYIALMIASASAAARAEEPRRAGPDWWSFQPLKLPSPPKVQQTAWVANPIDAFVLARLEAKGLKPSAPASRMTLIRRVTFDLTGLPPTPKEIDDFVNDRSEKAYEKLIDRLLASPHYGERWGRHWLDLARFSESHGFERDQPRDNAWRYRDYVIQSFNRDKPYADFVREQLAGGSDSNPEGIIATGFLVAGPYDEVGHTTTASKILRIRTRENELEEMLGTVGQTFFGLTVNCARCHDHKFDPFSTQDYYRLKAVLDGAWHGERTIPGMQQASGFTREQLQKQITALQKKIADLEQRGRTRIDPAKADADLPRPFAQWTFNGDARDQMGKLHGTLRGDAKIVDGKLLLNGVDAFVESEPLDRDLSAKTLEAWVTLDKLDQRGGGVLSIETTNGKVFDAIVFGEMQPLHWLAGSDFFKRSLDVKGPAETSKPEERIHLAISYASDGRITIYRNGEPYGDSYIPVDVSKFIVFKKGDSRILIGKRHTGGGNSLLHGGVDEARLYDRALNAAEIKASYQAGAQRISRKEIIAALTEDEKRALVEAESTLLLHRNMLAEFDKGPKSYAAVSKEPGPTFVYKRGDPELVGEQVSAGPPSQISGPPRDFESAVDSRERDRRDKLAEWIIHRDNPLTWRVIANRLWQYHFGEGIVRTPNDFGFNGERPTHPELLDWLAVTFRDEGGSMKKLHRLILLSATYRQSSRLNPKAAETDADNRLLWRYAPRRLEAETIRDTMLSVSGQLNDKMGGPSFRPFKIRVFNSTFYDLFEDESPESNRRSVYRMNVNSAKDPLLDVLDCPDPSTKTPKRPSTTTPLQALALMNSVFVQRQANALAERLKKEAGERVEHQVERAYRLTLGRPLTKVEADRANAVAKEHGIKAVCWALLNASEFVYIR